MGFGPLAGGLTHSGLTDEWINLDDYRRAMKAVVAIMVDWTAKTRDVQLIIGNPIMGMKTVIRCAANDNRMRRYRVASFRWRTGLGDAFLTGRRSPELHHPESGGAS